MKKVKLNESQLRSLVRGMINETGWRGRYGYTTKPPNARYSNERSAEINFGDPDADPNERRRREQQAYKAPAPVSRAPRPDQSKELKDHLINLIKKFNAGVVVDDLGNEVRLNLHQMALNMQNKGDFFDSYAKNVHGGDVHATVEDILNIMEAYEQSGEIRADKVAPMKRALIDWEDKNTDYSSL
jgi:hypothetical protein